MQIQSSWIIPNAAWIQWCWICIKGTKCSTWTVMWEMKRLVLPTMEKTGGQEYEVSEQVWLFSSSLGRLHFQLLQICPPLKMQTCFHMWSVPTCTHDIFCKNTIFLMYLHCASFNRNECPFLYLNMSKEYFDFWFRVLSGLHPGTSVWPFILVCLTIYFSL